MKRYMPQDVFDLLVIIRAMVDLAGNDRIFNDAVKRYVAMYPSEHAQVLSRDVGVAAVTAWELTQLIVRFRPPENDEHANASLLGVLEQLRDSMVNCASDRVPAKDPGGSIFNSSSIALPDRIGTCRKHLGLACQEILSRPHACPL